MSKAGYYVVRAGRALGIYSSWAECEAQVKGFPNAVYKKLNTEAEAIEFVAATARTSDVLAIPEQSSVRTGVTEAAAQDEKDCDIVYCDGSCRGNGKYDSVAGIGVWWGHGDPRNISERCPGDQTNNRAELIAIVRVLETTPHLKRRLLVKTDSNYSIQCVTLWIFNWMRNGFLTADGKPVKNQALIRYLAALLHARRKTSHTVEFKHVRGHIGIEGNEAADQLANFGTTKPVVPEPDWEKLEQQVLQSLEPVQPIKTVDDELKAYADGLLNDDELAGLAGTSVGNLATPVREPMRHHSERGKDATLIHTSVSPGVPHDATHPRANAPRPSDEIITVRGSNNLASGGSSRSVAAKGLQLVSSEKPAIVISEEELHVYAACLLDDDELSALGKDGMFDSDF